MVTDTNICCHVHRAPRDPGSTSSLRSWFHHALRSALGLYELRKKSEFTVKRLDFANIVTNSYLFVNATPQKDLHNHRSILFSGASYTWTSCGRQRICDCNAGTCETNLQVIAKWIRVKGRIELHQSERAQYFLVRASNVGRKESRLLVSPPNVFLSDLQCGKNATDFR